MAFFSWYVVFVFVVASDSAVDVREEPPHPPFADLDVNLLTDPSHRILTNEELSSYNGQNPALPIYAAVKGVVFDVSEAKDLYGPGQRYSLLTGKDGSRAIAKHSLLSINLNGNLDGLSTEELNQLEDTFHKVYMAKYPVVGYLPGYEPNLEDINLSHSVHRRKEDL
ncbi:hypothetical protein QZH41_018661 [Actinostola sp. cb2023]|nr:hypothetical protein QZH41_018661 [Actinostola sp. cb2023]